MKSGKLFIGISLLYTFILMALGIWWLYLLTTLSEKVAMFDPSSQVRSMANLVKWEGGTFLILLLLLAASLIYLYLRDQKKNRGLRAFYSGMTHELKTPLASIILQSEVINSLVEGHEKEEKLKTLSDRLIEDARKLETQMDKILQLGRIEGGGNVNLTQVDYLDFIHTMVKNYAGNISVEIDSDKKEYKILADEMALELIFKNLLENTKIHTETTTIQITIREINGAINTLYCDHGKYDGPKEKLGQLFFKFNSTKGSGIGLYLCKALTKAMKGEFKIKINGGLAFNFWLPKANTKQISKGS